MNANVVRLAPRSDSGNATPVRVSRRPDPAVYTVTEVAALLTLSVGSAYALVRAGDIPARKVGARWVIPKNLFHAWLDNLPEATDTDFAAEIDREAN